MLGNYNKHERRQLNVFRYLPQTKLLMIVYLCIVLHERIQNFLVAGNQSNILISVLKYRHRFITIHCFKVHTASSNQFHQLLGFVILQLLCSFKNLHIH